MAWRRQAIREDPGSIDPHPRRETFGTWRECVWRRPLFAQNLLNRRFAPSLQTGSRAGRFWLEQQQQETHREIVAEAEHLRLKERAKQQRAQTAEAGAIEPVLLPVFSRAPASIDARNNRNCRQ